MEVEGAVLAVEVVEDTEGEIPEIMQLTTVLVMVGAQRTSSIQQIYWAGTMGTALLEFDMRIVVALTSVRLTATDLCSGVPVLAMQSSVLMAMTAIEVRRCSAFDTAELWI